MLEREGYRGGTAPGIQHVRMIDSRVSDVVIHALESDAYASLNKESVMLEFIQQMQSGASSARCYFGYRHIGCKRRPRAFQRQADQVVGAAIFGRVKTKEHIGLALHVFGGESALACQLILVLLGSGVASLCPCERREQTEDQKDVSQLGHISLTTILIARYGSSGVSLDHN